LNTPSARLISIGQKQNHSKKVLMPIAPVHGTVSKYFDPSDPAFLGNSTFADYWRMHHAIRTQFGFHVSPGQKEQAACTNCEHKSRNQEQCRQ